MRSGPLPDHPRGTLNRMQARPPLTAFLPLLLLATLSWSSAESEPLPNCDYGDQTAPMLQGDPVLALVDTTFRLDAEFVPEGLVPVRAAGLDDDRTLIEPAVRDLKRMLDAANQHGLTYELQS